MSYPNPWTLLMGWVTVLWLCCSRASLTLRWVCHVGGPDLITQLLKDQSFLWPRGEDKIRDSQAWDGLHTLLLVWWWRRPHKKKYKLPLEAESGLWLTASRRNRNLSPTTTGKWILPNNWWAWKRSLSIWWKCSQLTTGFQACEMLSREPSFVAADFLPTEMWDNKCVLF